MHDIQKPKFQNGDAVVVQEGAWNVTGVVSEVYEDVVYVDYFDTDSMTMETDEFHESCVEHVQQVSE